MHNQNDTTKIIISILININVNFVKNIYIFLLRIKVWNIFISKIDI